MTKKIHLSIVFSDSILPVIECGDGHDRVPLKPIVDVLGIQWERQRKKIQPDTYLWKRLGAEITVPRYGDFSPKRGNPSYLCIRVDRVVSFLSSLSPSMIRTQGNDDAATWLESKHQEWDDALHDYETQGVAYKKGQSVAVDIIGKIDRIKVPDLKRAAIIASNAEFGLQLKVPEGAQA